MSMTIYARSENYNISYDEIQQEFYITSKDDNRPQIGSFKTAADAIDFAERRVMQDNQKEELKE